MAYSDTHLNAHIRTLILLSLYICDHHTADLISSLLQMSCFCFHFVFQPVAIIII